MIDIIERWSNERRRIEGIFMRRPNRSTRLQKYVFGYSYCYAVAEANLRILGLSDCYENLRRISVGVTDSDCPRELKLLFCEGRGYQKALKRLLKDLEELTDVRYGYEE